MSRYSLKSLGEYLGWFVFGLVYYTGFLLLIGEGLGESVRLGIAIGIGFAVVIFLLYSWEPPKQKRKKSHSLHWSSYRR